VKVPDETWSKQDFENKFRGMQKLVKQLEDVVAKVKPAVDYVLPADTGMYAAIFSPVPKIETNPRDK
jgi:hypothetical protein